MISEGVDMKWNALPEYFIEDIAEFLLFYLQ